jgi:hypothetical protein
MHRHEQKLQSSFEKQYQATNNSENTSFAIVRMKRKLNHEFILEKFQNMKSRNARSVKLEKERLKKHMIEREWTECSMNRKKTLEVKMQYNITRLSKEKRMNSLTQEAHNRISKEKEAQEQFYMKTQAKIVELKEVSEQEKLRLEIVKMKKSGIQEQYREMTESRADVRTHTGTDMKKHKTMVANRNSKRFTEIRTAEHDQCKPNLKLNLSSCNKNSAKWRADKAVAGYSRGEDSLESVRLEEEPSRVGVKGLQEITANSNSSRFRNYTNREENKHCISEIAEKYNIRYDFNSLEDFEFHELQKNKQLAEELLKQEMSMESQKGEERRIGKLSKQPMIEEVNKRSLSNIQEKSQVQEGKSTDQVSNPPELSNEAIVIRDIKEKESEHKKSSVTSILNGKQAPVVVETPEIVQTPFQQSPQTKSKENSSKLSSSVLEHSLKQGEVKQEVISQKNQIPLSNNGKTDKLNKSEPKPSLNDPFSLEKNHEDQGTILDDKSEFGVKAKQSTPVSNHSEPMAKVLEGKYQPISERLPLPKTIEDKLPKGKGQSEEVAVKDESEDTKRDMEKKNHSAVEKEKGDEDFWGFIDEEKQKMQESNDRKKKQADSLSLKTSKLYSDRIEEDVWGEQNLDSEKKDAERRSPTKEKITPLRAVSKPMVLNAGLKESIAPGPLTIDLRNQSIARPTPINEKNKKGLSGDIFDSLAPESKRNENDELEF